MSIKPASDTDITDAAIRAVIRLRRDKLNLSPEELGARSGIPGRTLRRYLNGDSRLVFGTVLALANALDTTVEELIRDAMELTRRGLIPVEEPSPTPTD